MDSHDKTSKPCKPRLVSKRLLDQLRERLRCMGYSLRTEHAYFHGVKAFIRRHVLRHPGEMGAKDRAVMLPRSLAEPMRRQLERSRALWTADRAAGVPSVGMPDALAVRFPKAAESWACARSSSPSRASGWREAST